jgi:transcriptional antiterminator NusG
MAKGWYVVHTYSGHENKVRESLDKAIKSQRLEEYFGQIVVATEKHAEMRNGKRTTVERKTFPSYVLIEMELNDDTRGLVTGIPGVTRFLSSGTRPSELREPDVKRVLGQMDSSKPTTEVPFKLGEHVRVVDGPFSNFAVKPI